MARVAALIGGERHQRPRLEGDSGFRVTAGTDAVLVKVIATTAAGALAKEVLVPAPGAINPSDKCVRIIGAEVEGRCLRDTHVT